MTARLRIKAELCIYQEAKHERTNDLFPEEYIKDSDCTKDTPVIHGKPDTPIYGTGKRIKPRVPGRQDTEHFKSIYLDSLLPLEEYDLIAILLSGGQGQHSLLLQVAGAWSAERKDRALAPRHRRRTP